MKSFNKFIGMYSRSDKVLRLGQMFVNMYIKQPYPALFYANYYDSEVLIFKWLYDHQYYNKLPLELER